MQDVLKVRVHRFADGLDLGLVGQESSLVITEMLGVKEAVR